MACGFERVHSSPAGRVLAVEDDPSQLELLELSISSLKQPLQLATATDGIAALQAMHVCDSGSAPLLLVLLDLRLPRLDGLSVLERAHQSELTRAVPFVVFTSSDDGRERVRALALGAVEYVVKPLGLRALREVISGIFERWVYRKTDPPVEALRRIA